MEATIIRHVRLVVCDAAMRECKNWVIKIEISVETADIVASTRLFINLWICLGVKI